MGFKCPACQGNGSLEIELSIKLQPDSRSDDIFLQAISCSRCNFRGVAMYEESRRGRLDEEEWEHTGYQISEADQARVRETMEKCSDPYNAHCPCPSHQILNGEVIEGRRQVLHGVQLQSTFPMKLVL